MRKADYALLADILRSKIEFAGLHKLEGEALQLRAVARQFASRANVDETEFLKACGIE